MNEITYVDSEMIKLRSYFPDMDDAAAGVIRMALREAYAAGERFGRQRQIQKLQDWASREAGPLIVDEAWGTIINGAWHKREGV